MQSSIQGGIGNCQPDATALLHSFDDVIEVINETIILSEVALMRKYDITERKPMQSDHDYADTPNFVKLSEFKAAISYISKYEIYLIYLFIYLFIYYLFIYFDYPG